jgi:hypothetical protein
MAIRQGQEGSYRRDRGVRGESGRGRRAAQPEWDDEGESGRAMSSGGGRGAYGAGGYDRDDYGRGSPDAWDDERYASRSRYSGREGGGRWAEGAMHERAYGEDDYEREAWGGRADWRQGSASMYGETGYAQNDYGQYPGYSEESRPGDGLGTYDWHSRAPAGRAGGFAGVGPRNYTRPTERIREDVCQRLSDDDRLDARDIEVKVDKDEVTLDGTVPSRGCKRRAEDLAHAVSGVAHVQNNLRVKSAGQFSAGAAPSTTSEGGPTRTH